MKTHLKKLGFIFLMICCLGNIVKADTYDWIGAVSSDVANPANWARVGGIITVGLGSCPGPPGSGDDVRIGVASSYTPTAVNLLVCVNLGSTALTLTRLPVITTAVAWKSLTFGPLINGLSGISVTVNSPGTLTVSGDITLAINNAGSANPNGNNYLLGTGGTITCNNIQLGAVGTTNSGNAILFSRVTNLNVLNNVNIILSTTISTGSGFRLEDGTMTLTNRISITNPNNINSSGGTVNTANANLGYFTIDAKNSTSNVNTSPTLKLLSSTALLNAIPSQSAAGKNLATINFNGTSTTAGDISVYYLAANPTIYTTSTVGFGTGGPTINSKPQYDNLYIQGTGTALVNSGSLVTDELLNTSTNTTVDLSTQNPAVTVGTSWTNSAIVTGGTGAIAVGTDLSNTGTINLSSGTTDVNGSLNNGSTTNSTAVFKMTTGPATVATNYTNYATFTAGSGLITFDGASTQSLTDNTTAGTTFNNVAFSNSTAKTITSGKFFVSNTGILSMLKPAAVNSILTIAAAGSLTLKSDATSSSSVATIPVGCSIAGTVNVQRFLKGGAGMRGYRLLSSPVNTGTGIFNVNYVAASAFISGPNVPPFNNTTNKNPTLYFYQENVASSNASFTGGNFKGLENFTSGSNTVSVTGAPSITLPVANGFMFYLIGDNINNLVQKGSVTGLNPESVTLTAAGTLNQGDVIFKPWPYPSGPTSTSIRKFNTGYYLLGNPYASSLDLNKTNLKTSGSGINFSATSIILPKFLVFNPINKGYSYWDPTLGNGDGNGASQFLGSGQGFFITFVANPGTTTTTVTFTEAAKPTTANQQPGTLLMSSPGKPSVYALKSNSSTAAISQTANSLVNHDVPSTTEAAPYVADIKLRLGIDSIRNDNCAIYFKDGWAATYNEIEDGKDLDGMSPTVYLSSYSKDSVRLALNKYPTPTVSRTIIPLYAYATTSGIYTFSKNEITGLASNYTVFLHDKLLNDSLDLTHNDTYNFNLDRSKPETYGANRFELVINKQPSFYHLLNFTGKKEVEGIVLNWKTEFEANTTYFSLEKQDSKGNYTSLYDLRSDSSGNYNYTDKLPATGSNIYRLKQTNSDGIVTYSKVINVDYSLQAQNGKTINVFPNPAQNSIQLQIAADSPGSAYNLTIVNTTGATVINKKVTGAKWDETVSNFTPGIYIINLYNESNGALVAQGKFIKK